jgi:hypothetical protein
MKLLVFIYLGVGAADITKLKNNGYFTVAASFPRPDHSDYVG